MAGFGMREFFATFVSRHAARGRERLREAFAAVPRETFAGPPPWQVFVPGSGAYVAAPGPDPEMLYQNVLVAIDAARGINIGEPSLHARMLGELDIAPGETVVQVGAGTGYYTAILAHLVGPSGRVHAYEIDAAIATRAQANLAGVANVFVHPTSGVGAALPACDIVYVSASAPAPVAEWLDSLRPGGRLVFPLCPEGQFGGMLLVRRAEGADWPARFICRAGFIPCAGAQDAGRSAALQEAISDGRWQGVQLLHRGADTVPGAWLSGDGWALVTEPDA